LCEAGQGRRKIADIAFEVGFKDLSYFNRMFRRK
jgi:AraC-like DNA-binding protein